MRDLGAAPKVCSRGAVAPAPYSYKKPCQTRKYRPRLRNALYAQSGGVSAVINASACGVIEAARKHRGRIGKIYAGRDGIIGALTEDLIDLSRESARHHPRRCATRRPAPSARRASSSRAWSRTAPSTSG